MHTKVSVLYVLYITLQGSYSLNYSVLREVMHHLYNYKVKGFKAFAFEEVWKLIDWFFFFFLWAEEEGVFDG